MRAEIVSEDANFISYRQVDKVTVKLRKKPQRTVICLGSLVQLWYAAGGEVVGIPRIRNFETLPEAARKLPVFGGAFSPNQEKIMSFRPDLIIYAYRYERQRSLAESLRRTGVETVGVKYDNFRDFAGLLDFFCRLNGGNMAENPEANRVVSDVERICRSVADKPKFSAAIVFATAAGFRLEGEESNIGTMINMLGGKNIAAGVPGRRVAFSYERMLMANPEVIFVVTMGEENMLKEKFKREIMSQQAWGELSAAKSGRVYFLPESLFLQMPGMRFAEAFTYLSELLYPERTAL